MCCSMLVLYIITKKTMKLPSTSILRSWPAPTFKEAKGKYVFKETRNPRNCRKSEGENAEVGHLHRPTKQLKTRVAP